MLICGRWHVPKGKTILDVNEAKDDGAWGWSDIGQNICKHLSPCFRQATTPTPRHSIYMHWVVLLTPNQQCQSTERNGLAPKYLQ